MSISQQLHVPEVVEISAICSFFRDLRFERRPPALAMEAREPKLRSLEPTKTSFTTQGGNTGLASFRVISQVFHPCGAPPKVRAEMCEAKRLVQYQVVLVNLASSVLPAVVLSIWHAAKPRLSSSSNCVHKLGALAQVRALAGPAVVHPETCFKFS